MRWFYHAGKIVVRILVFLLARREVKGTENIPRQGPLLVVANHMTLIDPPLLCISLNRKVMFMGKEELFQSRLSSYFMRGFGVFPVHRGRADREALRKAERFLAEGLALVMFPEGMRSKNAQLQPAFPGSALIARRSGTPILPVGITGTERIKGIGWLLRRPRITVHFGHPFHLPPATSKSTKKELTNYIMERVAELLPQEYRGTYARQGN